MSIWGNIKIIKTCGGVNEVYKKVNFIEIIVNDHCVKYCHRVSHDLVLFQTTG
jgi:hypothetical protein